MTASNTALDAAFSPEAFRALGHRWVDILANHMNGAHAGTAKVLDYKSPEQAVEQWGTGFPGGVDPTALLESYLASSTHLHDRRYMGHQVAAPLPLAALCQLATGVLNNGSIYIMGPATMAIERALAAWLCKQLGMGPRADAIFTSGGSLANLTALLAARADKVPGVWADGQHVSQPLAVLTSESAHYSIDRAVRILGWGKGGAIGIPLDANYRMQTDALPAALERARAAGRRVIAVVATAGSVPTGAYDPIDKIADFCEANDLWLHVDGAHGASAALSRRHRALVTGIERADSVVWDAHKMMMMPSLLSVLLFKNGVTSYAAFAQDASYLLHDETPAWADTCTRTIECTKNAMTFKLYAALSCFGPSLFSEFIDCMFARGAQLAALIEQTADFELALQPPSNVVMFRYRCADLASSDDLQRRILAKLRADGEVFIVDAELGDHLWLRTTLMNPMTGEDELRALLDVVRRAATV